MASRTPQGFAMWWQCVAVGMLLGITVEAIAWLFRLWEFRRRTAALVAIVVVYGLIMGSVAAWVPSRRWLVAFATGAGIGLIVELWNLQFGHWWRFPDRRDDQSRWRAAMVVALGVLWGLVPLAIQGGKAELRRRWQQGLSPAVYWQQREQALKQRRELLLQRLRDLDTRLQEVERRRKRVEQRQPEPSVPATNKLGEANP